MRFYPSYDPKIDSRIFSPNNTFLLRNGEKVSPGPGNSGQILHTANSGQQRWGGGRLIFAFCLGAVAVAKNLVRIFA